MKIDHWTTSKGECIPIDEMGIFHLRNTLKMLVRNHIILQEQQIRIAEGKKEQHHFELHGDMANEFNKTQEEDYYEEDEQEQYYEHLNLDD